MKNVHGKLERNLRKTTLLNTCNPMLMETILKVLREQFKDDEQRKTAGEIAGLVPETSLEWEPFLKERGGFREVNDGYLPEDLVLTADRWSRNKGGCVRLRNRKRLMEYIQKMFTRWVCLRLA